LKEIRLPDDNCIQAASNKYGDIASLKRIGNIAVFNHLFSEPMAR
jgi:hypothetical protein